MITSFHKNHRNTLFNFEVDDAEIMVILFRQLNETEWGYEEIAFPRASMISDEYKMPQFIDERDLDLPLGLRDTGDWSQDGQSLIVDAVSTNPS